MGNGGRNPRDGVGWGEDGLQFLCVFKYSGRLICDMMFTFYKALPFFDFSFRNDDII